MTRIVVICASFSLACAGPGSSVAAAPIEPSTRPPSSAASAPVPAEVRISAPACGYGGSAPAVAVFVDVTTPIALADVRVAFTLSDLATGAPRGVSREPEMLVVSPRERGTSDFSTQGTTPFSGALAAGTTTRLQYYAGLGDDPAAPNAAAAIGGPLRVNVVVHASGGREYHASCDTPTMWPSS